MYTVFKYGGASIKDASHIINVGKILESYKNERLVIVFSAIGKVTNMLESVVDAYIHKETDPFLLLQSVKNFHLDIVNELFDQGHSIFDKIDNILVEAEWVLEDEFRDNYSYVYDQVVSIGEFLSTNILSAYLSKIGFLNSLIDARDLIRTDNNYRDASVDWEDTVSAIRNHVKDKHCITQGFIGCTSENFTTTLGREGSDFSAAILAYSLEAKEVVIWKDVPGMMNSDPKTFSSAKLLLQLSFDEAIELAYFGAKVIHPRTIQPLKKKGIPLYVKSFLDPKGSGTKITDQVENIPNIPSFIVKEDQILISISDSSLSFIVEDHMSRIFHLLSEYSIRVNMMQNSAVSFSICVDNDKYRVSSLISDLQNYFQVFYNSNVSLCTIRNYTKSSEYSFIKDRTVLLEQRSRNTLQLVLNS